MRALPVSSLAAILVLGACAASPEPEVAEQAAVSGDEAPPPAPLGPPPSFLVPGSPVFARLDLARVRASPLAPDISSAIRGTASWRMYAEAARIDPIEDLDTIVVGADAMITTRRVVVIRHRRTDAEVRARLLERAAADGGELVWEDHEGYASTRVTTARGVVALVLTAEHEVVLSTEDDVARVIDVAREQARRRASPDAIVEPTLLDLRPGEIATFRSDRPLPAYEGYPEPPARLRLEVDEGADHVAGIFVHAEFVDAARAHAAHTWLVQTGQFYAQQMMVRAIGLHRPIEEAVFTEDGEVVEVRTTLTVEEIRRALGAMALMQLGGMPAQ